MLGHIQKIFKSVNRSADTSTGMFLHCVTLKGETHHSGDKCDKCYSFPSVQSWENMSSLLNSSHSAWLQFYNATLRWLGIWAWIINAVYSDNFKKFRFVFFCSVSCMGTSKCVILLCCDCTTNPLGTLNVESHLLHQEIFTFSIVCHVPHIGVNSYKRHWKSTQKQRWKGGKYFEKKRRCRLTMVLKGGEEI